MARSPLLQSVSLVLGVVLLGFGAAIAACSSDSTSPANAGGSAGWPGGASASGGSNAAGQGGVSGGSVGGASGSGAGGFTANPAWDCSGTTALNCSCYYSDFPDPDGVGKACGTAESFCCNHPEDGAPKICFCDEAPKWMCSKDSSLGVCLCEWALEADFRRSHASVVPASECGPGGYDVCCTWGDFCSCYNEAVWGSGDCSVGDVTVPSCATENAVPFPLECTGDVVPYCTPGGVSGAGGSAGTGGSVGAGGAATVTPQACSVSLHDGACGNCERGLCCDALEKCFANATCKACWSSNRPTNCASNTQFQDLVACDLGSDCGDACLSAPATAQIKEDTSDVECTHDTDCYGCTRCSGNRCILCLVGPLGCTCDR